jgi:hypothetical protein
MVAMLMPDRLKDEVKSQGGEIKHEYSLIKAFS